MDLLSDEAQVELYLVHLEIVLISLGGALLGTFGDIVILTLDRCTVCTERTIGSSIVLDAPNGTRK
jgi:hypothetical protein